MISAHYDQKSSNGSFRSNGYAKAVTDGIDLYVFWADRRFANANDDDGFTPSERCENGFARIVMSTSSDGTSWSAPVVMDDPPGLLGQQFQPSGALCQPARAGCVVRQPVRRIRTFFERGQGFHEWRRIASAYA